MRSLLFGTLLALAAPACSAPNAPEDVCPGVIADSWSIIHWSMSDGTSGTTGCHGPVRVSAVESASEGWRRYWGRETGSEPTLPPETRVAARPLPAAICQPPGFIFQNYPLVTGTTGPMGTSMHPLRNVDPNFFLELQVEAAAGAGCSPPVQILPTSRGGTFDVTLGGDVGDPIEFVVNDVSWDLPDGRTFTIDEATWHFVLTERAMWP